MTTPKMTVKLSSPASIAACVPSLLGFIPAENSLVVVSMVGKRMGMVARVDGPPLAAMERLAGQLADALKRGEPDHTHVHVIGWQTATGYADELYWALDRLGIRADECLTVQDGRVLDTCRDETNPRWVDLPEDVVRPASILETGAVVAGSREELAKLVAPTGATPEAVDLALASALLDIAERDAMIAGLVKDGARLPELLDVYAGLARVLDGEARDAALCLTALCAWLLGNGALASIALESCSPSYSLGTLLRMMQATFASPTTVRELIVQLGDL